MGFSKADLKTVGIAVGAIYLYHVGVLNFIPGFDQPKKTGK